MKIECHVPLVKNLGKIAKYLYEDYLQDCVCFDGDNVTLISKKAFMAFVDLAILEADDRDEKMASLELSVMKSAAVMAPEDWVCVGGAALIQQSKVSEVPK
jgi:hypothetical protein